MTPGEFIAKWRASELKESSAAQEHFIDLCRLLGEPTPVEDDPTGDRYCFERGVRKDTGGDGWADVWKRHHFAWEYKGKRANLDAAFNQLRQYALALENPPLLIVSDMARFRVRTNWTNSVSVTHEFALEDLTDAANRETLKWAMSDPERLKPGESRQALTERAAATFAALAQSLRERGHDPQAVAHFINRLVFCMFAEDVGLLPDNMFTRMLEHARKRPEEFQTPWRGTSSGRWPSAAGSGSRRWRGSTAGCSMTMLLCPWTRPGSRPRSRQRRSTGRRSTPRSWARCSSAGSTRTGARNSGRTTPTATRSCASSSPW